MFKWIKSGKPWIWLTSMTVTVSILSVLAILLFIGWQGLNHFWPHSLLEWRNNQGDRLIGQVYHRQSVPLDQLSEERQAALPRAMYEQLQQQTLPEVERWTVKVANRDFYEEDFVSVFAHDWGQSQASADLLVIKRQHSGDIFGRVVAHSASQPEQQSQSDALQMLSQVYVLRDRIAQWTRQTVEPASRQVKQIEMQLLTQDFSDAGGQQRLDSLRGQKRFHESRRAEAEAKIQSLQQQIGEYRLDIEDMRGQIHRVSFSTIRDIWYPNQMGIVQKMMHWAEKAGEFLIDAPRESNTEGGVFPAIFGTVLLVLLMSVAVMPMGVLAGLYLHEYAPQNWLTRFIRIAVHNLAGVPSIVYGVFGLGFFVYTLGGSIDELFYADTLPSPTFGTPGLLWASLTLAMLTLPVVVVSVEEGLSRIPQSVRDGSFALGATKAETIARLVLPMARPAMLTALILAVARAAGEVAPLMLVGVVKLTPNLPIDGLFPYIHLERKFMHLGFHIYDVGFQTANLEAAKSLVYATSMLLVTVIIGLNLIAIRIRNSLRENYRNLGFDEHVF